MGHVFAGLCVQVFEKRPSRVSDTSSPKLLSNFSKAVIPSFREESF